LVVVATRLSSAQLSGNTSIPFRTLNANSPYGLDPPSTLALPSEFQYYNDAKRILNDRPKTDIRVTPIALLYDPFGQFLDHIRDPPETLDDLDLRELEFSVNNFASVMCEYHRDENTRQEKVLPALNKIFRCYRSQEFKLPSIVTGSISTNDWRTDGHIIGPAQTPEIIVEIKNELGCGTGDPEMQLSAHYTQMHKRNLDIERYEDLFECSLLPALGVSIVGKS